MPPELTGEVTQEAAPDEVPELGDSEEVFPETPPQADAPAEPEAEAGEPDARRVRRAGIARRGRGPEGVGLISPPFVGLTGGIAAGKSEALAAFGRLGAATLSTDAVVHDLLEDPSVRDQLLERWGGEVVPGGIVDRGRVGAIVFDSTEELAWLESLLHPLVGGRVVEWRNGLAPEVELAVVEVPLLFETSMEDAFDATVAVIAADETRARRAGLARHRVARVAE